MAAESWRARLARYGAPAAFLVAATVAVLLIHSGLHGNHPRTSSLPPVTRPSPATVPRRRAVYYRVRTGDTLGAIADRFHTTVPALRTLNPKVDPNALRIGQRLRVR